MTARQNHPKGIEKRRMTESPIQGREAGARRSLAGAALLALAMSWALIQGADAQAPAPNTLPTGGQVTAGQAGITQSGSQLTINQGSASAIINWQSFSIGSQAAVTFNQPSSSSVALNRVVTGIPSLIFGKLTANGQVFLVNPGGILFGPGAQLNIGGLVATTMSISDADFLAGNYVFNSNGATSAVENQGSITASPGGTVALLAPTVVNEGTIAAPGGAVVLAAGEKIALTIGRRCFRASRPGVGANADRQSRDDRGARRARDPDIPGSGYAPWRSDQQFRRYRGWIDPQQRRHGDARCQWTTHR